MSRPRERVRLEDGLKLDLNRLIRQNLVRPGAKWGAVILLNYRCLDEEITTGKITADMTYARRGWLRLQFGNLDQWIDGRGDGLPPHLMEWMAARRRLNGHAGDDTPGAFDA